MVFLLQGRFFGGFTFGTGVWLFGVLLEGRFDGVSMNFFFRVFRLDLEMGVGPSSVRAPFPIPFIFDFRVRIISLPIVNGIDLGTFVCLSFLPSAGRATIGE